jgi:hypothetical protein
VGAQRPARGECSSEAVTLHSSWKGIILGAFGAVIMFVFGLGLTLSSGGAGVPVALLFLGVLFLGSVIFDYPVASRFTVEGVERRAPLRRHKISWDRVDQLTRARPGIAGIRKLAPGGLVVKVGRRRYLLVDQCESISEFDALGALLDERREALGLDELVFPQTETDPTWTYRRKRWQP